MPELSTTESAVYQRAWRAKQKQLGRRWTRRIQRNEQERREQYEREQRERRLDELRYSIRLLKQSLAKEYPKVRTKREVEQMANLAQPYVRWDLLYRSLISLQHELRNI